MSAALDRVMSDEIVLDEGEAFYLHPGELALAVTLESVTLPADLVGWLDGRSSLARLGLMVHVSEFDRQRHIASDCDAGSLNPAAAAGICQRRDLGAE